MTMRKLTLQLPEEVYQQLADAANRSHQSLNEMAMQSLQVGLSKSPYPVTGNEYDITLTRTWLMRGSLAILEPEADYIIGTDKEGNAITNYAENVDDVLYG